MREEEVKTEARRGDQAEEHRGETTPHHYHPSTFFSPAAFPALATMSCANLLLLPYHFIHTRVKKARRREERREGDANTHTWLQQTG